MLTRVKQVFSFKKSMKWEEIEFKDIQMIQKFALATRCLNFPSAREGDKDSSSLPTDDSSVSVVAACSSIIADIVQKAPTRPDYTPTKVVHPLVYKVLEDKIQKIGSFSAMEFKDSENKIVERSLEDWLRLNLLKQYLIRLEAAVSDGEITKDKVSAPVLENLVATVLKGSGGDRLTAHMLLYGETVDQQQTQQAFYSLLEPEVLTCQEAFLMLKNPSINLKVHKKKFPKFSKVYLLDKMELNTKSRCVFSWADPAFSGFKPLPDDHRMPMTDILTSREKYFVDAVAIGNKMMSDYVADTRLWYADKDETRKTLRNGVYFIFGTILLDWLVCSI